MEISFEHSLAWIIPIIAMAAAVSWWVYFYRKPYQDWKPNLLKALWSLRFLVLAFIGFLLLKPFLIILLNEEEKPRLLLYLDESYSVDSAQVQTIQAEFESDLQLSDKYKLEVLGFGQEVHFRDEKRDGHQLHTDFGAVFKSVDDMFYNDNIGAIVVASDGIQTQGQNPLYVPLRTTAPTFTIALGDSSTKSDFEMSEVLNNKLVFLGNDFQIKVRARATQLKGEIAKVKLLKNGELLAEKQIEVRNQDQVLEIDFQAKAEIVGVNQFSVVIEKSELELNTQNNALVTFIEVLDNRTKLKILAKAPHPDLAAFKAAIIKNEQYEVETVLLENWDNNPESADMFILHGLPSNAADLTLINRLKAKSKPMLVVFSAGVSLPQFNAFGVGININSKSSATEQIGAVMNQEFNLYSLKENEKINRLPPLYAPFGEYVAQAEHQVLLFQSIGKIKTDKPLLAFYNRGTLKTGVLFGEGWWKWRILDDAEKGERWTDDLILKSIQYLALKQKRNRLNVLAPKQISERQTVEFKAELYNESYELTNKEELNLVVTDSNGSAFDYRFQNSGNAYQLNLGSLPNGPYTWKATALVNGQETSEIGEFLVTENKSEFIRTKANFELLQDLADKKGGSMFTLSQILDLKSTLLELETAQAVIHTSKDWKSIIEWEWILYLIVSLLTIEWFLRKFNGFY